MIGIFKQKNPGNTLLLFIYALVLKFPSFLNPLDPITQEEDHYLYNWLLDFLKPLSMPAIVYTLLAFFLLLIQATLINRIVNMIRLFHKPSYLPAMCYILLTSFFPEWSQFSAPLLINTLLIWIYYRMTGLYNTPNPNYGVFNVGILLGLVTLFFEPAIVFILLVPFTLFIMRPFRIQEWLIGLVGVTTPYYFLGVILFLTDRFSWDKIVPSFRLDLPAVPTSLVITIAMVLLVVPFLIGGYHVQNQLSKMLIQVRKCWSLLLMFLIISMLIILANGGDRYVNWICCVVPLSVFHSAAYFYPGKSSFVTWMHWLCLAFALFVNYSPLFGVTVGAIR